MTRRDYAGAAVSTTTTGSINATALTIPLTSSAGWPSGTNGKFYVVLDRGLSTEEKVLVTSRSALNLTVATTGDRGVDGTSAQSHGSGSTVEHCVASPDVDEPNAHINDITLDAHTQYLNVTRHDLAARHTFGSPGALGAGTALPQNIDIAAAAGTAASPARHDHVHKLGAGSINFNAAFAAGVVDTNALGTGAVSTAKIADANVTTAKLLDANVTTAKLADASITIAKFGAALFPVTICTSTTRPATPTKGQPIYETDTDRFLVYTTATTGWQQPWNMPWGYLNGKVSTTDASNVTTETILTDISVPSITLVANRIIKIECAAVLSNTSAADGIRLRIKRNGNQIALREIAVGAANPTLPVTWATHDTGVSAGAQLYTATLERVGSGGTVSLNHSKGEAYLKVYDEGPAGAPA